MRKHFLILAALILAAAARPGFADQPDMSLQQDEDRPMPAFWRDTRYNLRWAGSASNLSYITRFIAEGMLEHLGRDTGYIAYGIGLWFGLQAMVSVGVNLGVLPTKGLTLPLISSGGSSMLMTLVALGIVLRIKYELDRDLGVGEKNRKPARGGAT